MRRDVLVYISGPLTAASGWTIEENISVALKCYYDLLRRGIPAFCPHLGGLSPSAWSVVAYQTWIQYDLAIIDRCTHVLMLPRWQQSKGAVIERDYAYAHGKLIISSPEEIACPIDFT